jgi:hypothetical protein
MKPVGHDGLVWLPEAVEKDDATADLERSLHDVLAFYGFGAA